MKTMRNATVAVLCMVVIALWGCPSQPGDETVPPERSTPEQTVPQPEQTPDHEPGEHMDEDSSADAALSGEVVDGTRVIEVEAKRYEFIPSPIVVKKGQPVRLEVTATDVMHGFGLEAMGIDRELPPNETQTIEFTPHEAGEFHVHCSHYCGPGHDEMHTTLVVRE